MRIVLLSDIHGNLPALEAVRDALPANDGVIAAGDLCLDGGSPELTLDMLHELGWVLLKGNTDRDIVSPPPHAKPRKQAAVGWARERLGQQRIQMLADLPLSHTLRIDGRPVALVVHANPLNLDDQLHPTISSDELRPYLEPVDADLLAFGHLHTPYIRPVDGVVLVDIASVGHPKDRDPRSVFTVVEWEGDRRSIAQVRVPYDVERATDIIRRSGMPYAEEEVRSLLKASY